MPVTLRASKANKAERKNIEFWAEEELLEMRFPLCSASN